MSTLWADIRTSRINSHLQLIMGFVRPNQTVDYSHKHVRYVKRGKKKQDPNNEEEPPDYSKVLMYCAIGVVVIIILVSLYSKYGN